MPRKQNILLKYKCSELCCGKIIREDKWLQHCKSFHAFKLKRGDPIKRKPIEYKVAGGKWLDYRSKSDVQSDATIPSTAAHGDNEAVTEALTAQEPDNQCSRSSHEVGIPYFR
jgi:hypothetical protein